MIVPSNHLGVATRRMLGSGALGPVCGRGEGVAAVTFLTVYRLAELLGSPVLAEQGRRPVSTPVLAASVAAAPWLTIPACSDRSPPTQPPRRPWWLPIASCATCRRVPLTHWRGGGPKLADVVRLPPPPRATLEHDWYDEGGSHHSGGSPCC